MAIKVKGRVIPATREQIKRVTMVQPLKIIQKIKALKLWSLARTN
jgi:hypothetical protein